MDIGLYNLKYPARALIRGVLPRLREVDPNLISWSMIPVGVATALVYYLAARGQSWLYLVGVALILLRMFLGTLDGLVAVHYQKSTPWCELVNRLTPEICDVLCIGALCAARSEWRLLAIAALAVAWLTSFAGLLGAVVGQPPQSVGPVGQTDRMAALVLFSVAALLSDRGGWGLDFMAYFLIWTVAGGLLTVLLRCRNQARGARAAGS